MIRALIPFSELTRGVPLPEFEVSRRPMVIGGETFEVGSKFPADKFEEIPQRIRQFYEMRLIVPVIPPSGSVQSVKVVPSKPVAAAPIKPAVKTVQVVTAPTVAVPVAEASSDEPRSYVPSKGRKR